MTGGCPTGPEGKHDFSRIVPVEGAPAGAVVVDRYCSNCGQKATFRDRVARHAGAPMPEAGPPPPPPVVPVVEKLPPLEPIPVEDIRVKPNLRKFGKRYDRDREMGIVDQAVNLPHEPRTNDAIAAAAEEFVCAALGIRFLAANKRPDDGADGKLHRLAINVKWTPHEHGGLLVKMNETKYADIYVLVTGDVEPEAEYIPFVIRGWATRAEAHEQTKDLGFGRAYYRDQASLRPFEELLELRNRRA